MDFELEIEGIKVKAKIDTGFDGEITKDIFDMIPYDPSNGARICTASMECYSTFVKLAKIKFLGKNHCC